MPELPEVETVRRGLFRWVVGRTIDTVEVLHLRSVRRHVAGAGDFAAVLAGRTITGVNRRGKYLWLALDSDDAVVGHLGMSGQLLVLEDGAPAGPHLRIRFTFTDGGRSCASSTSGPSAGGPSHRAVPRCRRRSRISRWTRSTRPSTRPCSSPGSGAAVPR